MRSREYFLNDEWDEEAVQREREEIRKELEVSFRSWNEPRDVAEGYVSMNAANMAGVKAEPKTGMLIQQLKNKCDKISTHVFDSYRRELGKDIQKPETFENYEVRAQRWLGLKQDQLPAYFVSLKEKEVREKRLNPYVDHRPLVRRSSKIERRKLPKEDISSTDDPAYQNLIHSLFESTPLE